MTWDITTFLVANSILIVASILQMATGVSVGMIIVPFLAMISYTLVPTPIIFASLILTIMMSIKGKEHIDLHNTPLVSVGMLVGIFMALFLFDNIKSDYLGLVFGLLILVSVFISIKIEKFQLSNTLNFIGGVSAGFMGSVAAVGGQILALLFQNHPLDSIKATLAFLYTIFSIVMLSIFYYFDQFSYEQMISGLYMMPGFIIGFLIAPRFSHYFKEQHAKPIVLLMAVIGSLLLIGKSVVTNFL
jgi:uncharacterized protein